MTDNAKELLALAEKALLEINDMTTDRRLVNRLAEIYKCAEETLNKIAARRLSARQQASVESLRQWLNEQPYKSSTLAEYLLAKYNIFEKVEG